MRYAQTLILLPAVLALASLFSAAQQNSPPATTNAPDIRTTTHAVVLDVTVLDRKGNPIRDLERQDFAVSEDGVPQTIASFDHATLVQGPPTKPMHLSENAPVRSPQSESAASSQTVIIIDELNTQFTDLAYARYSLKKFLQRNGAKLDGPAQLLALTDQGLRLVHDYTWNGAELMTSVDKMPARLPFKITVDGEDADRANVSLGVLEQTALANEKSGRRTAIIWISPGYPVVDKSNIGTPEGRVRFEKAVKNLSKELLDARVTIYSIDPRGVIVNADDARDPRLNGLGSSSPFGFGDMALGRLAVETGGHAYYGRNDVDTQVANSLAQSAEFYTLSYYPTNRNYDGKFRRIHVEVRKPELAVQTRTGYYAFPDQPALTLDQVSLDLKRAMFTPLAYTAIPFSVTEFQGEHGKKRLDLKVDGKALQWEAQPNGDLLFHVIAGVGQYTTVQVLAWREFDLHGRISADDAKNAKTREVHLRVDEPEDIDASELRVAVCDFKSGLVGTEVMKR